MKTVTRCQKRASPCQCSKEKRPRPHKAQKSLVRSDAGVEGDRTEDEVGCDGGVREGVELVLIVTHPYGYASLSVLALVFTRIAPLFLWSFRCHGCDTG